MKKAIVIDLDGTLCNAKHREHLAEEKKWDMFHAACVFDTANEWCYSIIDKLAPLYSIIFITGRPEKFHIQTENWLRSFGIRDYTLYMKPDKDFRPDFDFKEEVYKTYLKGNIEILFAADDRKDTAKMWRSHGIVCLHCADGEF